LAALQVRVLRDEETRLAAFRVGVLDVLEVPGPRWEALQRAQPRLEHLRYPTPNMGVELALRTTGAPFSDVRLRRALFLALDPWSLNRQVWGGLAFVSSGAPVREPEWLLPEAEWSRSLNDPPRARELLAAAAALGTPVEVVVADHGDPYLEYGRGVVEQLQSAGFDASVRALVPQAYADQVWETGRYAVSLGPPLPIGTPNAYLFGVLHSDGQANRTGYTDAELDRLIEAQRGEWNPARRRQQALQIQQLLLEEAVRFMPAAQVQVWAWWPRVQNLHLGVANYEYAFWSRVWVEAP
jgi:peptide/nickel transport system substrate-binding protein